MRKAAQLISCRDCPRLQFCWELLSDNTISNENWPTVPEPSLFTEEYQNPEIQHQDQDSGQEQSLSKKLIAYISNGVRCSPPEE